ncbi:MAG: CopG family transcriptional regulator [Candidatus Dormiibacterota bacterium]
MFRTNIYLDESQTAALDELAGRQAISRAELVRRMIDQGLGTPVPDLDADLRAISESFAALGEGQEPWSRQGDARERHLGRLRAQ